MSASDTSRALVEIGELAFEIGVVDLATFDGSRDRRRVRAWAPSTNGRMCPAASRVLRRR
jgi:hypothetical protein